jgi:hypothetical protein
MGHFEFVLPLEAHMAWFWGVLIVSALLFLWGYGDLIAGSQKIASRARDQLHKERLMAMEKGLPPPDGSFDAALLAYVSDDGRSNVESRSRAGWALALALGGVGWSAATIVIPRDSPIGWLHDSFSFGFIPMALGLGIFLQAVIGRRN